jgi:hypothetical protein
MSARLCESSLVGETVNHFDDTDTFNFVCRSYSSIYISVTPAHLPHLALFSFQSASLPEKFDYANFNKLSMCAQRLNLRAINYAQKNVDFT